LLARDYISETLYGGLKSRLNSVDLEFKRNGIYYLVGIKSGTYWGNSDKINRMKDSFKKAKQTLKQQGVTDEIIAVNGCMYGKDRNPLKEDADPDKSYYKYAVQELWNFISEDENLYQEIIVPIDQEAKNKDELFKTTYQTKVNEMTFEFMQYFMNNGQIDWVKLVNYVSKKGDVKLEASPKQMMLDLEEETSDLEDTLDFADVLDSEEA
jgi:Type II restriction endonuclease EcoO109I